MCSFKRAMAIAIWSPRRRSSCLVSLRNLIRLRMRSRAWRYSSSSLACSGQDIARVEREHMKHLLKTSRSNVAARRTKSKHYFRLLFVRRARPAFAVSARQNSQALRAGLAGRARSIIRCPRKRSIPAPSLENDLDAGYLALFLPKDSLAQRCEIGVRFGLGAGGN